MEDGTDAKEKSPQSSAKLRNEVELHHPTQMVVVAGGMRLEFVIRQSECPGEEQQQEARPGFPVAL